MKLRNLLCLLCALLTNLLATVLVPANAQQIYKVIHADGTVTYTDVPQPGAIPVDLSKTNSAVMPAMPVRPSPSRKAVPPATLPAYQLSILNPSDQQSVRSNNGDMTIVAKLSPEASGQFQLVLDKRITATQATGTFQLQNLDRGEHQLQVNFVNNSGKILASSPQQTFYLHRASVLINPN